MEMMLFGIGPVAEWLRQGSAKPYTAVQFRPGPHRNEGMPRWWNGRHRRLKISWLNKPCGFESHSRHRKS